ncbi:MAG TPA: cytochrome c-type biogenesis CcmF C-terminal domain-containing protein [Gaiellaceae bacterium]|jgi:cytochrome c-type biogenesis protein CcmF|nr:cytochrome c-type biogenesis CcmF C-terminal domain-containing protein [Gaiellaceae bacterium]
MADLGRSALVVSLGLALYALVAGTAAAITRQRRLADSARYALIACFGSTVVASGVLVRALLAHDFTYAYVAQHTSRDLKPIYTLTAFWGGEEGSLLLWLLVLTGYGALAVTLNRKLLRDIVVWVVPVLAGIAVFFSFMLVVIASPFVTQARQVDGAGLVPSLQNIYMVIHPPMLYLGYVGMSVPFAFACAAMLSGKTDERWIVATRRWTLTAWTFLGFGLLLGSHWAYIEVGWGGYYAWDPVENAALMPWIAGTAFLHSVMIQERKGMLRVWNMVLVALTYELTVFGTFLNRSGVIESIHSFAKSSIGGWFLGFVVASTLFSLALILWRLPLLRAKTRLESPLSREATFLYNNLLLIALCLTVLWGELWPILTQIFQGVSRTIGEGYYDFFLRIFGIPLLLLMGIGPLIAWRRSSGRALARTLRWPIGVSVVAGVVLVLLGAGTSLPGLIGYTFCIFVLTSIVVELVRGTIATGSLFELVGRNRRRYGGYVVHAAIVLLAVGIIGSGSYGTTKEVQMKPGQTLKMPGYTLTYKKKTNVESVTESGQTLTTRGTFAVTGNWNGSMTSAYVNSSALGPSHNVGIHTDWSRAEDLYVIFDQPGSNGTFYVKVLVKPLVNMIWIGGYLFVFGSLIAMWPDAREQRRLVARLALARA